MRGRPYVEVHVILLKVFNAKIVVYSSTEAFVETIDNVTLGSSTYQAHWILQKNGNGKWGGALDSNGKATSARVYRPFGPGYVNRDPAPTHKKKIIDELLRVVTETVAEGSLVALEADFNKAKWTRDKTVTRLSQIDKELDDLKQEKKELRSCQTRQERELLKAEKKYRECFDIKEPEQQS